MQSNPSRKPQHSSHFKRFVLLTCFFAVAIFSLGIVSGIVDGDPLSFVRVVLGNGRASAQTILPSQNTGATLNSQRYPLPSHPANTVILASSQSISTPPPIADGKILSADLAAVNTISVHESVNTQISVYTVRDGDTIGSVAKVFDVSVNTILWANDLSSRSVLKSGQILIILPVTGITYEVRSGDTIQGIAKKYDADVEDVLNYNDLTLVSKLRVGDKILLPNAELAAPVAVVRSTGTGSIAPVGSNLPSYSGYFSCPVPGASLTQKLHGNNGIDLAASSGTSIRAAAAGSVIISRANGAWNGGYGNFVVVLHPNGTQTLYSHMLKSAVYAGEQVTKGEVIGYIGRTGLATGNHLHFEVRGAANPFSDPAKCR